MSQSGSRLAERLEQLPPDAQRALDAALERAQVRAQRTGQAVWITVEFEVWPHGVKAVELPARYEWRAVELGGGAT